MTHSNLPDRTLDCFPVPSQVRRDRDLDGQPERLSEAQFPPQECVFQDVRRHSSTEQGYRSTTISLEGAAVLGGWMEIQVERISGRSTCTVYCVSIRIEPVP